MEGACRENKTTLFEYNYLEGVDLKRGNPTFSSITANKLKTKTKQK